MTNDEVIALIRRWREHRDERARTAIIIGYRPLVMSVLRRYSSLRVEWRREDAIQEGLLGVAIAIDRYREDGGAGFLGYARTWIRARLSKLAFKAPLIRGPDNQAVRNTAARIGRAVAAIEKRGEAVTDEALAAECGTSVQVVREVRQVGATPVSLDMMASGRSLHDTLESSDSSPEDLLADIESQLDASLRVHRALSLIDPCDGEILRRRVLAQEPETLALVGARLGISRERVRQREARGLKQLTAALRRDGGGR